MVESHLNKKLNANRWIRMREIYELKEVGNKLVISAAWHQCFSFTHFGIKLSFVLISLFTQ